MAQASRTRLVTYSASSTFFAAFTPLELFFDLVFVFAITQVTRLLADDPTWAGVFRGMFVRADRGLARRACDRLPIFARRRLTEPQSLELHRLALHAYSYLHPPMIAGIVLFALGLKTTVGHVGEPLDTVPAVALCGGAALYLLAHIAWALQER